MNSFNAAGLYLVNTVFDIYLIILGIRLILAWEKANYFNPITQFIIKVTQPVINPIRRAVPTAGKVELATLLLIFILELLKFLIVSSLFLTMTPNFGLILLVSIITLFKLILNIFFFAILLNSILSWISIGPSPIAHILMQLSEPVLRPLRKIIPTIGGIDITPVPALILLQFLIILI